MSESTNVGDRPEDILDEDHPHWYINEQIKDLLLGFGSNEDSRRLIAFLQDAGLPFGTAERIHHALVGAERDPTNVKAHAPAAPNSESNLSADSGLHGAACSLLPIPDAVLDALPEEVFGALIRAMPLPSDLRITEVSGLEVVTDLEGLGVRWTEVPTSRQQILQSRLLAFGQASPTPHD
jgi:hypothetical protein